MKFSFMILHFEQTPIEKGKNVLLNLRYQPKEGQRRDNAVGKHEFPESQTKIDRRTDMDKAV